MLTTYRRIPESVRWALLFPVTVVLTGSALWLVARLAGEHYLLIRQAVAISCFMVVLHALAPRWQNRFAVGVLIARMVIFLGVMAVVLARGNPMNDALWFDVKRELIGWAVAWALFFSVLVRPGPRPQ
jgi:hypothetical protein